MRKWIETTGRSEEDAIAVALFQLGLDRNSISVEVLERAKPGFLGFGSNPARVRVSYGEDEEEILPEVATEEKSQPAHQSRDDQLQPGDEVVIAKEEAPVPAAKDDAKAQRICDFLTGLMAQMEIHATPELCINSEGGYDVVLQGQDIGAVIGRRGETLDAIQQLTNYAVNRGQSKRVRVHIDAEGYRAKREETLQRLAVKMADKVLKYRRNFTLEPMNAYERHVVHSALQDYPGVTTYSTGTEPNRRVVVAVAENN